MSKGLLIAVAVGLVLAGAGGYVYFTRVNSDSSTPQEESVVEQEAQTLRDLIAGGSSLECTYKDSESNSEGRVKVAGGKMRGDFSVTAEEGTSVSHMISDGERMYVWSDDMDGKGFMYTVPEGTEDEEVSTSKPEAIKQPDLDKALDYKCSSWNADQSVFTPPADIEFSDYSEFLQMLSSTAPEATSETETETEQTNQQCAACESLSGDMKAQCLQALKCN